MVLVGKSEEREFGWTIHIWKDNIKKNLKEAQWVGWTRLM
jgi:hypothetical protein